MDTYIEIEELPRWGGAPPTAETLELVDRIGRVPPGKALLIACKDKPAAARLGATIRSHYIHHYPKLKLHCRVVAKGLAFWTTPRPEKA